LTDVLSIQADIARAIALEIQASLRPEERTRLTQLRRVNPDAHQAYLQGNYFLHQNIRGITRSVEWFRRAIDLDSSYSDAYAGLAQALIFSGIYEFRPFSEAYSEARTTAAKALQLDESNAAALNALADIKKGLDWDLEGAEKEQRRALELSPSHLLTRLWHADTLSRMERHDEALSESARAVALDPVSAISHNNRAMLLWRARRYDEAIREAQVALDLEPGHVNALWWQGLAFAGKGDFQNSLATLQRGLETSHAPMFVGSLGFVHGLSGDSKKAHRALDELHNMAKTRYVSPANFATVYAGLGEAGAVFLWLEKAYEARDGRVQQLVWPIFDRFRNDPHYQNLKNRIGLDR
jgi:tetratricopeptide (TPR) repeat protein